MTNISYLEQVNQSVPEDRDIADVIKMITSDDLKSKVQQIREEADDIKSKQLKKKLPLFFPTVQVFNENALNEKSIPTGIVQFDIDTKENPGLDCDQLKATVCAIPETIYAFESPRGGLKFGISTDFVKNDGDDIKMLKDRYQQAYRLTLEYIQKHISVVYDNHMKDLKVCCFLSWDKDAYFNPGRSVLKINDQCVYDPPQILEEFGQDVATEQIEELLEYIPRDMEWGERRTINFAVFSCIGKCGIPLMYGHWITSDREKLRRDLNSQCGSIKFGNYGHLVNIALENGYKCVSGKARKKIQPKPCAHKFEPMVSYEDGMKQLNQHLQDFFATGKNTFINVSTGAGKTEAAIQFLQDLPKRNNSRRHDRIRVLVLVPDHDLAAEYKQRLRKRVNHIRGKRSVCEVQSNLDPYYKAGVSPPIQQCMQGCHVFETCPYIRQFNDVFTNIRIMTHDELVNAPPAWLYGSMGYSPRKVGWKPDMIIVDEDWLKKEEHKESYSSTEYQSIQKIIHECGSGKTVLEAVNTNIGQILNDYSDMESGKAKKPKYKNSKQYITDVKNVKGTAQSHILTLFHDYIVTGDDEHLRSIRFVKSKDKGPWLCASSIKPISDRYSATPTLFLDATADAAVVNRLLDVEFHSIAIAPNEDINLYQLQGRTMLKKDFQNAEFRNQVVTGLRALVEKYERVGLISYKEIGGVSGNFSQWLGDQCGIQTVGHFGNIRGSDKFKDVDCLLVVGRYLIPEYALENYCYSVFGEASKEKEYADIPVRMKDGNNMSLNNRPFVDARMRHIKKHFSDSETVQAIGRARLIHGNPKDIYLFSHESLGGDVQVTDFFELDDFIDSQQAMKLKEVGYCLDKPKSLKELGYPTSRIKEQRQQIEAELQKAGIKKVVVTVKDHNRNTRPRTYYVHDMEKLEQQIAAESAVIVDTVIE